MGRKVTPPAHEQGELFIATFQVEGDVGHIDATGNSNGVYPSDISLDTQDVVTFASHEADLARAAEIKRHRQLAQLGKHTVHEDAEPNPGDALPGSEGIQVVTWRNLEAARVAVAAEKQLRSASQPPLFSTSEIATSSSEQAHPQIRLDTLGKRLDVLVSQAEGAKFVPATKSELTVGLPTVEFPYVKGSIHQELMATHDRQKRITRQKGYNSTVANWEAQRAIISRIYEIADYLADAYDSFQLLTYLQRAVDESYDMPMVNLAETFQDDPRALLALRYLARDVLILQLKDQKVDESTLGFLPMTGREVRSHRRHELPVPQGTDDESKRIFLEQKADIETRARQRTGEYSDEMLVQRDKTVYSPFAPQDGFTDPKLEDYIDTFVEQTTIGQLRQSRTAGRFASLQQNRYWHWRYCIADVRGARYRQVTEEILSKYPIGLAAA